MSKKCDYPYINSNGKYVPGTAALIHYVYTVKGGIQHYNDEVGNEYIKEFANQNLDIITKGLLKRLEKVVLKQYNLKYYVVQIKIYYLY